MWREGCRGGTLLPHWFSRRETIKCALHLQMEGTRGDAGRLAHQGGFRGTFHAIIAP